MRKSTRFWIGYKITYTKRALRDMAKLGAEPAKRLRMAFERFVRDGHGRFDAVAGILGSYELKVGPLRAEFCFLTERHEVLVYRVWRH